MTPFPVPLDAYPPASLEGLVATLSARAAFAPFNLVATGIFLAAIAHTFGASAITAAAHRLQHRRDARARANGQVPRPSVIAEFLHLIGEVEVVFGLWAAVLLAAVAWAYGWNAATSYLDEVSYTEPLFVIVIMALASTRPIVTFAESALRHVASIGRQTPAAWWLTILIVGPLLGSLITEPGAMTISALLLARQFYDLEPSLRLKYATLGLLFVNVSVGGTLTHFAAPPVLMVSGPWQWDTAYMLTHIGWRAIVAIVLATTTYFVVFRHELRSLALRPPKPDIEVPDPEATSALLPIPRWVVVVHIGFMAWTILNVHHPPLFLGGFLFFLGFARATAEYQTQVDLRSPLLVGFFLAGLVIHGGLQGWWIAPTLAALSEEALFAGATILTGFNDNALITYLATLAPDFSEPLRLAVVQGAVTGGGLTVIANAPNPAGQAILGRFFGSVSPISLLLSALLPTALATAAFRLL